MASCSSKRYLCSEDVVTLDDIESPCVSVDENNCTSCENVRLIRKENVSAFNESPLLKLFGKKADQKTSKAFWKTLNQICDIKIPSSTTNVEKKQIQLIVGPDMNDFESNSKHVFQRSSRLKNADVYKIHLLALYEIALLTSKWNAYIRMKMANTEEALQEKMKRDVLDVLLQSKVKFGAAHHPREFPIAVGIYMSQLAKAPTKPFKRSLHVLSTTKACAEAVLQAATDALEKEDES